MPNWLHAKIGMTGVWVKCGFRVQTETPHNLEEPVAYFDSKAYFCSIFVHWPSSLVMGNFQTPKEKGKQVWFITIEWCVDVLEENKPVQYLWSSHRQLLLVSPYGKRESALGSLRVKHYLTILFFFLSPQSYGELSTYPRYYPLYLLGKSSRWG